MGKIDNYIEALETLGNGRYHYYDGKINGIGCSEYTRLSLVRAGIISNNESFHAASGNPGPLEDTSRFQKLPWSSSNLQKGDILWSDGHHVATWDGQNGVYEAAPESSHGICDNGKTGVGHWSNHTYWNCGTGTKTWSCIYRIIDSDNVKDTAKEVIGLDKMFNVEMLAAYLPVIKRGSTGDFVKALQKIMTRYGWYNGDIDGSAGPLTEAGIKNLQIALGVVSDGCFALKSWIALLK